MVTPTAAISDSPRGCVLAPKTFGAGTRRRGGLRYADSPRQALPSSFLRNMAMLLGTAMSASSLPSYSSET